MPIYIKDALTRWLWKSFNGGVDYPSLLCSRMDQRSLLPLFLYYIGSSVEG